MSLLLSITRILLSITCITLKFVLNLRRNEDLDSHYTEKKNVFILMMSISNTPRKLYHE